MSENKILGLIGLAKKAGKVVSGADLCEREIRTKKSELIIIANDISPAGRKAITDICNHYKVKNITFSDKEKLGIAVGAAGDRSVVSVNERGFCDAVLKKYADFQLGRNGE